MEKSLDIRREVLDFWRDLRSWCEEVRVHAYGALDYGVLGRLQSIEVAWPRADVDALSTLRALGDVVLHLEALSPCDVLGESLLTRGRRLSRLGAGDFCIAATMGDLTDYRRVCMGCIDFWRGNREAKILGARRG